MKKNWLLVLWIAILLGGITYTAFSGARIHTYISNGNAMVRHTTPYQQTGRGGPSILVLGDSLAYGVGASRPEVSFAGRIGANYPTARLVNRAKVGADIDELARSVDGLVDRHYNMIFVIIGGNDISHYKINLKHSRQSLAKIYQVTGSNSDRSFVVTTVDFKEVSAVPIILKNFYSKRSLTLRLESKKLASRFKNVTYVDAFGVSPGQYRSLQANDGFHLNDLGIEKLVELTLRS